MREWNGQAVILRIGLFHEADLWLKMLCGNFGLFTVFAFGGAKSKKRFCGCLDIFNTINCRITRSGNGRYMNLAEAALLDGARKLRSDWKSMGVAANCMLFLETLEIGADTSGECFAILENLRSTLESGMPCLNSLALFFRLRVASALGFAPNFSTCGDCGNEIAGHALFAPSEGRVFCPPCASSLPASQKRQAVTVSRPARDGLSLIQSSLPAQWSGNGLNREDLRACGRAIDGFIQFHLGIAWDNGRFRHI